MKSRSSERTYQIRKAHVAGGGKRAMQRPRAARVEEMGDKRGGTQETGGLGRCEAGAELWAGEGSTRVPHFVDPVYQVGLASLRYAEVRAQLQHGVNH